MKVKVIKAGMSTYWYSHHIGETFEVEDQLESDGGYSLKQTEEDAKFGGFSFVADDAEVLKST